MANKDVIAMKEAKVNELADSIKNSKLVLLVDYRGITVEDVTKLRNDVREAKGEYRVIKNNIIKRALNANGENITENAKNALKFFKANAKDRKSIKLKKIDNNILYVTMTEGQKNQIKSNKVISFKALIGKEILDPYGQGEEVYLQTCNDLIDGINVLIDKLIKWR